MDLSKKIKTKKARKISKTRYKIYWQKKKTKKIQNIKLIKFYFI